MSNVKVRAMSIDPIASYTKSERLFLLYIYLPRGQDKAKSLTEMMVDYGNNPSKYATERKNLENDLSSLHVIFSQLLSEDNALIRLPSWDENISGKTARYYIDPDYRIEVIDQKTLFFWEMLTKFTSHYLPASLQQTLVDKLGNIQRSTKHDFANSQLGHWHEHLITLPNVVQAPQLNSDVVANIHEAILQQRALEIEYHNKWQAQPSYRVIYPIGLVFIDNMMYLTGFNPVKDSIDDDELLKAHRNFAVSRIKAATVVDTAIPDWVSRDAFSLNNLNKLGKLELTFGDDIRLVLKVQKYACQHLFERPLSADQKITQLDDTWNQVTATVANTQRLHDWLVGMSQLAVVVKPLEVREVIYQRLQSALDLYKS